MSSPIGGFYLNAQYRKQADQFELDNKLKLELTIKLELDGKCLIEAAKSSLSDSALLLDNEQVTITLTPSVISETLIQIHSEIIIKQFDPIKTLQQQLTIESGEQLSTLVEGEPHLQLTLGGVIP
ncbi:hypothetical protein [Shewanella woodyi]|uniref:Uncharacterized protein n=1 Tax=Shewanella woodyi (strain ATCC 51908 / MS32) TaxID=392500 RepID=B1KE92_SHEWM|nr:hypothetical protein [Shewanella woodyi]ACA85078.1 conserved hypothetical protein [Shewanella woodyi ATCC 51908]